MWRPALLLSFLAVSLVPVSVWAQTHMSPRAPRVDPAMQDTSEERDLRHNACAVGDMDACFAIEFGSCADRNPRTAIRACTDQLAQQDSRRTGGNIRYERAIRYTLRAYAYSRLGETQNALRDYDRAVAAEDGIFWIHLQRGDAYFRAGDYAQALTSYDAAIALNDEVATAVNNRALIFAAAPDDNLRDGARALADAQRANELMPGQPAYVDVLGVAYAANGDFDRAAEEAQRAIDLLPAGNEAVANDYRSRLELYRAGTPFRIVPRAGS